MVTILLWSKAWRLPVFVASPDKRTTSNASALSNMTLEECQSLCWTNCSCVAFSMIRDMCLSWPADLMDIRVFAQGGNDLYVRLAASELDSIRSSGKQKSLVIKVSVPVLSFLLLLCVGSFLWLERRSKLVKPDIVDPSTPKETELDLPLYRMVSIRAATNEFSRDNIVGMGGFGFIYKGKLADGQEVAVKRLSKASEQGTDEFKTEVSIIAKLQHRNLVRLLGYCIEDEERILIYEFMTNKSLDTFIFGHVQSVQSSQRS
ncbi:G-type lectin S-receptor-like serine/threonine-protein kinase At1g61400 [Zingiber officinale]|uniref:G-type lectin S-receptor-like serine/threonine-protein kinase At1g61400 n=1 Tax=Zingiber officinale TaxID=94328 RepID=UPI001C4A815A|nr:G-type lectin S-receptor-like serine/threonine-protein kinase At1g61400 [Zingiber officinale]XP_042405404.1 G-type lectin S-receptor-like serine/threonine-protein kinase At1g61400 [Zingiber officinale]XP_042405405.1 G-type lectin S-receptor-like serine/threonine-protein kinase At1g61400 [Zingiber officinale]XP_042405406.1 G-type lectin S-receptor-like serine/threonine-protein kinase At1g61400 [Zingiber officinale]XP_042405407.1 G-type lectin S-receptor-like serine/threonine-protein kinase At